MKLTPDDEAGIPSRASFTGVGSSRASLCDSPVDENVDFHVEKNNNDADNENINEDHSGAERPLVPASSVDEHNVKSETDTVDNNNQPSSDHNDDVDVKVVSSPNQSDNDASNEMRTGPEHSEGGSDDAEKKQVDSRSIENSVNDNFHDDIGMKCHTPKSKDDVVDDSGCSAESEDKKLTPMQEDRHDIVNEHQRDSSILQPTNEPSPTNTATSLQGSNSADPQRSSSPLRSREPSQQGSTRSLRSLTSRQHGETSRRYSDSSRRTIRSGRSSSGSSSTSSSGSSSGSDSSSCSSSDSESDSESNSSSNSSSSYSSSGSNNSSPDSESSSSGTESDSSSDDDKAENDINDEQRRLILSEKCERISSRNSGPSSSFSFAPEEYADVRKDKKSRGKRSRKTAKLSYETNTQRRRYEERDVEQHHDACSTVCIIL